MDTGFWLKEITSEEQLTQRLNAIITNGAKDISDCQTALAGKLDGDDIDRMSEQLRWLDSKIQRMGFLKAEADALLDKAELFYLIPAGRSVPCTTEDGIPVPATGCKVKDPLSPDFQQKYVEMTTNDRSVQSKAKCAVYRLLRDELQTTCVAIETRMRLGQQLLKELSTRNHATGYRANV